MSKILKGLTEVNSVYGHSDPDREYGASAPTNRKRGPYSHTDDDDDGNPFAEYERQQKMFAIGRAKKAAKEKAERDSDHARLATGTNESFNKTKSMITETRTYKLWESAGQKIVEAQLTADQINQIFSYVEKIQTAGGDNRTMLGKGKDVASAVNKAWEDLKTKVQDSGPIKGVDALYDKAAEQLKQATGGDEGVMKYVQKYRDFAKKHPVAQGIIYSALIAAAGISGAGVGGAAALGLFKLVDKLLQGEKFSSAAYQGAKTGAMAYGASKLADYVKGAQQRAEYGGEKVAPVQRHTIDSEEFTGTMGQGDPNLGIPAGGGNMAGSTGGGNMPSSSVGGNMAGSTVTNTSGTLSGVTIDQMMATPEYQAYIQRFGDSVGSRQAAMAAAKRAILQRQQANESVDLTESQLYLIIGKIVERQRKLDEGIMDTIKGAAGKAMNWAQTKGTNLTTKVTADKLLQAWKKAGSPMDSLDVASIVQQAGVPSDTIKQVYGNMKIPFAGEPGAGAITSRNIDVDKSSVAPASPNATNATPQPSATTSQDATMAPDEAEPAQQGSPLQQVQQLIQQLSPESKKRLVKKLRTELGIVSEDQLNELSNEKLSQYKTAAAADAGKADLAGDYKKADKRFGGIVKATKKQFANDTKKYQGINEFEGDVQSVDAPTTNKPPRQTFSIVLQGKPGVDFGARFVWQALQNVFPNDYPIGTENAEWKVVEVKRKGSAIIKSGINNRDIAETLVAKLVKNKVPERCLKIISSELDEGDSKQQDPFKNVYPRVDKPKILGTQNKAKSAYYPPSKPPVKKLDKPLPESLGDELTSKSIQALQQVKQQLEQQRMADLEQWEKDFKQNTVAKFVAREPNLRQRVTSTPTVAMPGEKHADLKIRLGQLDKAIEKQQILDNLVQKLEKKGLLTPNIEAGVDTSMLVRDGAKDNYVELNRKLDKALEYVKNRLMTNKAAFAKPKAIDEDDLDENCWKGYHKEGNKELFGKTVPNCVKNEGVAEGSLEEYGDTNKGQKMLGKVHQRAANRVTSKQADKDPAYARKAQQTQDRAWERLAVKEQGVAEEQHSCPHCGGEMVSEELMNEKKDACYYKVKSRYKVWPSAYASGALVKCRKKGADNWGNGGKKNESSILEGIERVDENLHQWFKEKWVRFGPDGKIRGDCARGDDSEGKPKCLPQAKAHNLGKKGRASAAARKRREDPNPERSGKAINVNTKKKSNEDVLDEKWSQKYKDSINCSNPKGFSQKAHCAGKKK